MENKDLAKQYSLIKNKLFFINLSYEIIILLLFFSSGLSLALANKISKIAPQIFLINAFYILSLSLIIYILCLPFGIYEGFILEHKFNLSNQGFFDWLKESVKWFLLNLIILVIFIEIIYFLLRYLENIWWLLGSCFWLLLTIIIAKLTPSLIIPIFFKYIPLYNQELKEKIFSLFDKCNIKLKDIFMVDFSKKTKKANAFICGLGKNKRVVLTDNLLNNFNSQEIAVVVAHELGHLKNHDTLKLVSVSSVSSLISFFIMDRFLKILLIRFGFLNIYDIAFFPILAICFIILAFILMPFQKLLSRTLEKKADLFSLQLTKTPLDFISMIIKLGKMNLSDFFPSKFREIMFYDHPPIYKRIKLAENFKV